MIYVCEVTWLYSAEAVVERCNKLCMSMWLVWGDWLRSNISLLPLSILVYLDYTVVRVSLLYKPGRKIIAFGKGVWNDNSYKTNLKNEDVETCIPDKLLAKCAFWEIILTSWSCRYCNRQLSSVSSMCPLWIWYLLPYGDRIHMMIPSIQSEC